MTTVPPDHPAGSRPARSFIHHVHRNFWRQPHARPRHQHGRSPNHDVPAARLGRRRPFRHRLAAAGSHPRLPRALSGGSGGRLSPRAAAALQRRPSQGQIIVLGLGLNDALEMRSVDQFEADLRDALRIIHSEWRTPVLTGIVDVPVADLFTPERVRRRHELNQVTLRVAEQMGVSHARWGEDYRGVGDVIDNIHRTQVASDRLAALLVEAIERTF
nr:GDSL-type esterase/lipase family protein [Paracidovorax citrulli]